jgi:hypothetical protein
VIDVAPIEVAPAVQEVELVTEVPVPPREQDVNQELGPAQDPEQPPVKVG